MKFYEKLISRYSKTYKEKKERRVEKNRLFELHNKIFVNEIEWRGKLIIGEEYYYRPFHPSFYGGRIVNATYLGREYYLKDNYSRHHNGVYRGKIKQSKLVFFFAPKNHKVKLSWTYWRIFRVSPTDNIDKPFVYFKTPFDKEFLNPEVIKNNIFKKWYEDTQVINFQHYSPANFFR